MSAEVIKACKPLKISPTQKSVLMAVAWYASDDGEFWGSVATIMEHTCLSERAVRKTLHDLSDLGLLRAEVRNGTSTKYTVTPCTPCTPAQDAPLHQMQDSPAPDAPPPLHLVHPTPAPGAPNKLITTKNKTNEKQESVRGTRLPADWMPGAELSAWALDQQTTWNARHLMTVTASFRDYWTAQPGTKGRKTDWDATFRNWVRREKPIGGQQSHRQTLADYNRQIAQEALVDHGFFGDSNA